MNSSKKEIRKTCLARVSEITNRTERSFLMKEELLNILKGYSHIGLFVSLDNEIDTVPLIDALLKEEKNVYLPKVEGDIINFYQIRSLTELEESNDKYKLRQPVGSDPINPDMMEVIICPGVGFDKDNNRLGHGKGYYDRYLFNHHGFKIGICYKEQLLEEIPISNLDVKMDKVLTY